ncbi:MAG: methylmalonyl Co-A mutase-associated GTPase MeaB [Trueperaceae bacterium]|nr:methylmalonyl Co-A mutase-associated GTPase MeaB [Trueperaceae bacterium]
MSLVERFQTQDERALARAISLVERGGEEGQRLLRSLRTSGGHARIIGITGSPGSGKSTLTDQLIGVAREQGRRVAVIAVDPTSPYSGGAILGDRIRMMRWHKDPDVYIRSMATRGHLGGLASGTLQVLALLDAYGFDYIFIETVGVGQSEVDIVRVADTTLLVLTPGQGDGVQAFKAGIMEIADVFAINKYDLPGGPRLKREIQAALELSHPEGDDWWPIIQETIAAKGEYSKELFAALTKHYAYLEETGKLESKRLERIRFEISSLLTEQVRLALEAKEDDFIEAVLQGEISPLEAARQLLS